MCEKCLRKSKRLGHKPLTYGQIKSLAHKYYNHEPIPLFSTDIMYAIEGHIYKIQKAKTKKKYFRQKNGIDNDICNRRYTF